MRTLPESHAHAIIIVCYDDSEGDPFISDFEHILQMNEYCMLWFTITNAINIDYCAQ